MEYNKQIRNTWIMVAAVTAVAFMISGIIQLNYNDNIWIAVMRLFSALLLFTSSLIIRFKSNRIFNNPTAYVILFFFGYVLSLIGLMTELRLSLWTLGSLSLMALIILPFRQRRRTL